MQVINDYFDQIMDWASSSGASETENISSVCQQNQPIPHESSTKGKNILYVSLIIFATIRRIYVRDLVEV